MVKLQIDEIIVLLARQNDTAIKTRHVCSRCKKKRYIGFLRFSECGNCLICRNNSKCQSKK